VGTFSSHIFIQSLVLISSIFNSLISLFKQPKLQPIILSFFSYHTITVFSLNKKDCFVSILVPELPLKFFLLKDLIFDMGGLCSKSTKGNKSLTKREEHYGNHKSVGGNKKNNHKHISYLTSAKEGVDSKKKEEEEEEETVGVAAGTKNDDFYDGIPRYADSFSHKSRSVRSRQAAVAKVCSLSPFSCLFHSILFKCSISEFVCLD